jgi:tripartite-type tricarboxylate transporter receptor subunit TctC
VKFLLVGAVAATLLVAAALPAGAQTAYPTRPVRVIVLTAAGGALDIVARVVAQSLSEQLGQQFVVENKLGAGGNIGAAELARAAPDGSTIGMITTSTHGVNPTLYKHLPFDPMNDFAFLTMVAEIKNVVVANPTVPVHNIQDLIAYARANPGKLNFGSAGTGTSQHLAGELFKMMAQVDIAHVPFKGASQAVPSLLAGEIQLMFCSLLEVTSYIQSGQLRALGVTSLERSHLLPDVVPVAEQGLPGYDVRAWFGMAAPKATPPEIVAKLNREINAAVARKNVQERFASLGIDPGAAMTPDQFRDFVRTDIARWAPVVKESGATAD